MPRVNEETPRALLVWTMEALRHIFHNLRLDKISGMQINTFKVGLIDRSGTEFFTLKFYVQLYSKLNFGVVLIKKSSTIVNCSCKIQI